MTEHMSHSLWGVAYCCFAVLAVAASIGVSGHIDPSVLAMH